MTKIENYWRCSENTNPQNVESTLLKWKSVRKGCRELVILEWSPESSMKVCQINLKPSNRM